jgi:hypothetical protein
MAQAQRRVGVGPGACSCVGGCAGVCTVTLLRRKEENLRHAEGNWRTITAKPYLHTVPALLHEYLPRLEQVAKDVFDVKMRGRTIHNTHLRDDLTEDDVVSGRLIVFPTANQFKVECNTDVIVEDTFWTSRQDEAKLIKDLGVQLAKDIRDDHPTLMPDLTVAPGYPLGPAEMEFMCIPIGAQAQSRHQTTRRNILTAFLNLGPHPSTSHTTDNSLHSTYVATHVDINDGANLLQYHQIQIPLDDSGYPKKILLNHGTWPHGGPGNRKPNLGVKPHYILFFSFPLDEEAASHVTAETVYPVEYVGQQGPVEFDGRVPDKIMVQGLPDQEWTEQGY